MADRVFNPITHLERLREQRDGLIAAARELRPRNAEDDELIRCGIIGFAQHVSLKLWDADCFQYVRAMSDDVLGDEFSVEWRRFTSLAAGYFLGMRMAELITDLDLRLSAFHTPGFMWLKSESFDGPPLPDDDPAAG